jgi:hypothetical protein
MVDNMGNEIVFSCICKDLNSFMLDHQHPCDIMVRLYSCPLQAGSLRHCWFSRLLVANVEMTPSLRVAHGD